MGLHYQNHEHAIVIHDKQPHPLLLHCPNIEPPQLHQVKNNITRTKY